MPRTDARMKNMSLSGALMESDCDLRLYTFIEVSIALPPPSSSTAIIKAYVSRKSKGSVGIEWYEFAPDVIKDLLRSSSRSAP